MTYEDDLRDAGRWRPGDVLAGADWRRAEFKDSSACYTCGSPDPAIIEGKWCCDCAGANAAAFAVARAVRIERESNARR